MFHNETFFPPYLRQRENEREKDRQRQRETETERDGDRDREINRLVVKHLIFLKTISFILKMSSSPWQLD